MYKVLDMFKFKRNRKSNTMHKTMTKSTVTARATKTEELYQYINCTR